ncbi:MAG: Holliday junction resolvase RuvX [Chitinophagales bacterium]
MARILAIDYGAKRVGIAVTDPMQLIATALTTVETKSLYDFLKTYLQKEDVEKFVVGYPYNHGHRLNDVIKLIDQFLVQLQKQFPEKSIEKVDERFSSRMASRMIAMSGLKKSEREKKGNIDKVSATIILQTYLEMKSSL